MKASKIIRIVSIIVALICIGAILLIIYYFKTPDFDPKHMSK